MTHAQTIGQTLQLLRLNLDLSRDQLAAKLKMPVSAVIRHETGRKVPSVDELLRYLKVLRCTAEEFERIRAELSRFRERTDAWWHTGDLTAPADNLGELGDDVARLARRFLEEFVRKLKDVH